MTMQNIRQNLFFTFIYNALGIPVATGLLYPFFGILLSPMIADSSAVSRRPTTVIVFHPIPHDAANLFPSSTI